MIAIFSLENTLEKKYSLSSLFQAIEMSENEVFVGIAGRGGL